MHQKAQRFSRVKVAEINRTKATEWGVDLLGYGKNNTNGDEGTVGSYGGQVDTPSIPLSIFGTGIPFLQQRAALPGYQPTSRAGRWNPIRRQC